MVRKSKEIRSNKNRNLIRLILLTGILFLINIISSSYFFRVDLTSEKRYTLSETTKELVSGLEDVVYIRVYLDGDFPASFKRLQKAAKEMLDELRIYSNGNIEYEFINPSEHPDPEERNKLFQQLASKGLQPTNLREQDRSSESQQIIFPGALVNYRSQEIPLMLLQEQLGASPEQMLNNSVQSLEYSFANCIRKVITPLPQDILILDGYGVPDNKYLADISRELRSYYSVERKPIGGQLKALKSYDAVIIAGPDTIFGEKDKFIIDQYIMKGGKVLWCIDGANAYMDSLQFSDYTLALSNETNLDDMLFRYGARVNNDIVMDLQAAPIPVVTGYIGNKPQQSLLPWYFFPVVIPSSDHPIVNNLNAVKFEFASSIDSVGTGDVSKTALLTSSEYSRAIKVPARIDLEVMRSEPEVGLYDQPGRILALLLEGKFTSNYKNRLVNQITDDESIDFREESDSTAMIIISDGSVIMNGYNSSAEQIIPLGFDRYTGQMFGNMNFILNCVDYLCDDSGLMALRGKEFKLRLLDKTMITEQRMNWQMMNTILPVSLVLLLALIKYIIRTRKYGQPVRE